MFQVSTTFKMWRLVIVVTLIATGTSVFGTLFLTPGEQIWRQLVPAILAPPVVAGKFLQASGRWRVAKVRCPDDDRLDHIRSGNDIYGHAAGDKIIGVVADILSRSADGKGIATRFGGQEIAISL